MVFGFCASRAETRLLHLACRLDAGADGAGRLAGFQQRQLQNGHAHHLQVDVDAVHQWPGDTLLVALDGTHRAGALSHAKWQFAAIAKTAAGVGFHCCKHAGKHGYYSAISEK
jgi:hypothetical protein